MNAHSDPVRSILDQQGFVVLDGALATELERHGADLDDPLWSARCLVESPAAIKRVHSDYLSAGADVLISATYQASVPGFRARGLDEAEAEQLLRLGVELAIEARDEFWSRQENRQNRLRPLVAASIGPFGACLHDGSEYHGNYRAGWSEVKDFHRSRLDILSSCNADLFAFETIPSLREAEILLELVELHDAWAWLSFSCQDEQRLSHGELFERGVELTQSSSKICAVGVNCTPPDYITALLNQVPEHSIPLLAYPNSGETWVAESNCWVGQGSDGLEPDAWFQAGARLIGGCCRTGPEHIAEIRSQLVKLAAN